MRRPQIVGYCIECLGDIDVMTDVSGVFMSDLPPMPGVETFLLGMLHHYCVEDFDRRNDDRHGWWLIDFEHPLDDFVAH